MPASGFDDVLLVNPSGVRPAPLVEVDALESALGGPVPRGYAAFVVRLGGEGVLGHLVRVVPPGQVLARTSEWRARVQQHWFWDTSEAGVEPAVLQQAGVLLADTVDGDELCVEPAEPETLYLLPRDEDVVHRLEGGFLAALGWLLSGELNPWVEGWTFEAWHRRVQVSTVLPGVLADHAARVEALGEHSHAIDLGDRRTYVVPSVEGRLSLWQQSGGVLMVDLSHDEAAPAGVVARLLRAVGA